MNLKISRLSYIPLILALMLTACSPKNTTETDLQASKSALMTQCSDMGEEYIDSFIFIGESTTAHLRSRGVLKGGKNTCQVWSPKSGTMTLDTTTTTIRIVYPETGEELTVGEAANKKKPRRVLFTFGLNGAVDKIKRGERYFKTCYTALICSVTEASPDTEIILGACFPVARSMDMSLYTVDATTLNSYITTINSWTLSLAEELGLGYLNTAEALCDSDGFLKAEYQMGDGYHLTEEAYRKMLMYMRTHGRGDRV